MITIKKPYITIEDSKAFLKAPVTISEDTAGKYLQVTGRLSNCSWLTDEDYPPQSWKEDGCLWFSVDSGYAEYLTAERSNAFVLALFWYAMVTGSDICFEAPISQKLFRGLTEKLMPELKRRGFSPIKLSGEVTPEILSAFGQAPKGCATGMSCGVDSFYTLSCYENTLTHLTFYDGSYILPYMQKPYSVEEVFRDRSRTFAEYIARAEVIAEHHDLPFLSVNTNMDKDFYRGGYIYSAMYRHTACSLALEKLFAVYISSSSGHREHSMEVSLFSPTQLYEDLLCDCLQTESFHYMTSDHDLRTTKIERIADDKDFQSFAEVCFNQRAGHKNCGKCFGCWKTMIPLDMMGKLHLFQKSFDLEDYYKNRRNIFSELIHFSFLPESASAKETVAQLLALAEEAPSDAGREFKEIYWNLSERD